jgi:hypothetical protein
LRQNRNCSLNRGEPPPPAAVHAARPPPPAARIAPAPPPRMAAPPPRMAAPSPPPRMAAPPPRMAAPPPPRMAAPPPRMAAPPPRAGSGGGRQEVPAGCPVLIVNGPDPRRRLLPARRYSDRAISSFMISLVPP